MLKQFSTLSIALLALCVAGCAAKPNAIPPTSISSAPYANMSCGELNVELKIATAQRDAFINKQKGNRTRDILLNALYWGSGPTTTDHEEEVANSKGKVLMIEGTVANKCTSTKHNQET